VGLIRYVEMAALASGAGNRAQLAPAELRKQVETAL